MLTDLCEAMAKESNQVYIISLFKRDGIDFSQEEKWAKEKGIHVKLMQEGRISQVGALFRLRTYIESLAKDEESVLFLHLKWGVLAGILTSICLKNVKRVEVYHSGYMHYSLQAFLSKPFIDHYIAVSKEAKEQLENWFNVKGEKISVIYNGVDVRHIKNICQTSESRAKDRMVITSVGRLSFEKGFLFAIKGFIRSNCVDNVTYKMIGTGAQLEEAQKEANGKVIFTGVIKREEVYKELNLADIVIMPSLWEGNSILLLEALAVGKALAVSDIPSFRGVLHFCPLEVNELYRKERFGWIFKKESIEACTLALQDIYQNQKELPAMAKYVSELADCFSTEKQSRDYKEISNRLFDRKKH